MSDATVQFVQSLRDTEEADLDEFLTATWNPDEASDAMAALFAEADAIAARANDWP